MGPVTRRGQQLVGPAATRAGYFAYVLLGRARDNASRRVDLEARAETMR